MKAKKGFMLLMLATIFVAACNDDDDSNKNSLNQTDENFVQNAAMANMAEVRLGQLAATNAQDSAVRAFGQQMVSEHTTANDELKQISDSYSGATPFPTTLDQHHDSLMTQLNGVTGMQFDSIYISSQVMDHQKAQALFQAESQSGKTDKVKAYAAKYLPHITEHLQKATSLQTSMSQNQNQNSGD
jgi:putative membrane protein